MYAIMFHAALSIFYKFGTFDEKMRRYFMATIAIDGTLRLVLPRDLGNPALTE
ncbi:MAG: hypothetical protein IKS20_08180 [Victivallales bacterium]|nr:hypothetical protein [Victivallales bacterium]